MKSKRVLLAIMIALALLLGACATPPDRGSDDDSVVRIQSNLDHEYIEAVNRSAQRRGARVYWVNPPERKDRER